MTRRFLTKKDLLDQIKNLPDDAPVIVDDSQPGEFRYATQVSVHQHDCGYGGPFVSNRGDEAIFIR
jgi:hypothetical protein